jgi:hypothetical protein
LIRFGSTSLWFHPSFQSSQEGHPFCSVSKGFIRFDIGSVFWSICFQLSASTIILVSRRDWSVFVVSKIHLFGYICFWFICASLSAYSSCSQEGFICSKPKRTTRFISDPFLDSIHSLWPSISFQVFPKKDWPRFVQFPKRDSSAWIRFWFICFQPSALPSFFFQFPKKWPICFV